MKKILAVVCICLLFVSCAKKTPKTVTPAERLLAQAHKKARETDEREIQLLERKAAVAGKIKEKRLDLYRVFVLVNGKTLGDGKYVPPSIVEVPIKISYRPQERHIASEVLKSLRKEKRPAVVSPPKKQPEEIKPSSTPKKARKKGPSVAP